MIERLLQTAQEPVLVTWGPDFKITGWYMGAEKTFGWSSSEAIGQPYSILYTPEDVALGIPHYEVEGALKRGYSENDRWMLKKGGGKFWANGVLSPIHSPDGQLLGFGKILRDRTDGRIQVDTLERLVESLRQGGATKALAASTVAHELRGPLSAITNAMGVLQTSVVQSEVGTTALEIIARQCQSMTRLIEDLLDNSRLQVGKLQIRRERIDLARVATAAVETCQALLRIGDNSSRLSSPLVRSRSMATLIACNRSSST